ncbi:MAG: polysaccharide export protein [Proteobacteria bacterium]|nr:polysaccharide export protein [Pseudomonadota bacterium]
MLLAALALAACGGEPSGARLAAAPTDYRLGPGDRLRVEVFGEPELSGDYDVDAAGAVPLKLGGRIEAKGLTSRELEQAIEHRLAQGFLQNPHVTVSTVAYRPFYVLGEVLKPGPYPYVAGMTVAHGVAIAGGYTYRASRRTITVQHFDDPGARQQPADETSPILPGDLIRIGERLF